MNQNLRLAAALMLALCMVTLAGCQHSTKTLPPGAINTFDADSYNTLITCQAAINSAVAQFGADKKAIPFIDDSIASFNTAIAAYKTYHNAGGGNIGELQADLNALVNSIAHLQKQINPSTGVGIK